MSDVDPVDAFGCRQLSSLVKGKRWLVRAAAARFIDKPVAGGRVEPEEHSRRLATSLVEMGDGARKDRLHDVLCVVRRRRPAAHEGVDLTVVAAEELGHAFFHTPIDAQTARK